MEQLKCPNCGTVFQVEESDYIELLKQVRDKEFLKELDEREAQYKKDIENALKLQKAESEATYKAESGKKDLEIADLKSQIASFDSKKELAVKDAIEAKDKAINAKEKEIIELNMKLTNADSERKNAENALKEKYALQIKAKDDEIAFYKDYKAKQSTKMIGESLERFCEDEFNKLRATGFQNAYFEKDNDARTGSKGDYIFRDKSNDGTEYISIMFEMKNEADETAAKHKNEDFFKELDKDRKEKKCEYAVLVSMLESESELYNTGIVDVSYKYEKMYVIRPQFFIPMITLLRNAAMNSLQYRQELTVIKNQNIDISNFEDSLIKFKDDFGRNYKIAHDHFDKAIDEIDKTITHLQKVKAELQGSDNQLRIANDKVGDVSVKKLTKNNPTMAAKFAEVESNRESANE